MKVLTVVVMLLVFFVGAAEGQDLPYLHIQVNKAYGQLDAKEKLAAALRLEDSAKSRMHLQTAYRDALNDLEFAIVLYAQVARQHPAVVPDLTRALAEVSKVQFYYFGLESLTDSLLHEHISGNTNLGKALDQVYQLFLARIRETKFNASLRYNAAYMKKIAPYGGVNDPFYCNNLLGDIEQIALISTALNQPARIKLWELHLADAYFTGHNCENDLSHRYDEAFELYNKHGETLNARKAAENQGDVHLDHFATGEWGPITGKLFSPAGRPRDWAASLDWYKKAGLTSARVKVKLRKAAADAEATATAHRQQNELGNYQATLRAAIQLYEHLGNKEKVVRLSLERR